jgi:hypothetical protein
MRIIYTSQNVALICEPKIDVPGTYPLQQQLLKYVGGVLLS